MLNYETKRGMIKHFYGFNFTLGGIVSITGYDFENMNGFPNYWGWGYEDNVLHNRALNKGLYISRSNFFKIGDSSILHLIDDFKKILDKTNHDNCKTDNFDNGINYIENLFSTTSNTLRTETATKSSTNVNPFFINII